MAKTIHTVDIKTEMRPEERDQIDQLTAEWNATHPKEKDYGRAGTVRSILRYVLDQPGQVTAYKRWLEHE